MPVRFNEAEAASAVSFFPQFLAYSKGPSAGQPFVLREWQAEPVRKVFGTQRYDDEIKAWVRLIRTVYEEVPRKNGKTEKGAGIALKLLTADGEQGAEVYSVAEDLDQANKVFGAAVRMVESSPALSRRIKVYKRLMEVPRTGNLYRVIPGDARGNHGHNPHGVIFDELHTQPSRELWDVMTSGQGTRAQPLTWAFSTAGTDRTSICWEQHDYGEKVAKGILTDPSFLYLRHGISEGEDWEDEEVWRRCNPALGDFLFTAFLRDEFVKAKASPARQNTFRNLYLNEWTSQSVRWIDMGLWDSQSGLVTETALKGRKCFGGLDLGSTSDLTAWVLVFPNEDGSVDILPRLFCPQAQLDKGPRRDVYAGWAQEGFITVTPGSSTDYSFVRRQINADADAFDLRELTMDYKFQGGQLGGELIEDFGEGFVFRFGRGFAGFAQPMQEFERLLLEGKVHHGGNPVLRWMADNVVVKQGALGDLMPDKDKSQEKIDGIVGLVMALDGVIRDTGGEPSLTVIEF